MVSGCGVRSWSQPSFFNRFVANGYPGIDHAQQFLRVVFINPGDFTVSVPGDLTGQWLTGTISRTCLTAFTDPEGFPAVASHEETSDLGPPLKVSA